MDTDAVFLSAHNLDCLRLIYDTSDYHQTYAGEKERSRR